VASEEDLQMRGKSVPVYWNVLLQGFLLHSIDDREEQRAEFLDRQTTLLWRYRPLQRAGDPLLQPGVARATEGDQPVKGVRTALSSTVACPSETSATPSAAFNATISVIR
jgi:hypothetical protein